MMEKVAGTRRQPQMEATMIAIDYHRGLVFPNNIRKFRKQRNVGSLLELAERLPDITYIRLSKIERGEIFARADELRAIARALGLDPVRLLVNVDDPDFDIAHWAEGLQGNGVADPEGERMAVLLAAAVRARRGGDPALTIAVLETEYGIAPVMLSRIENALKPLERWNADVRAALCRLFGVADDEALAAHVEALFGAGQLDAVLPLVANPELRLAKSRARIAELKGELSASAAAGGAVCHTSAYAGHVPAEQSGTADACEPLGHDASSPASAGRVLPVFGAPLPDGLIARVPTDYTVDAPRNAGPRAYGLRFDRPTLGAGLPGRAVLVVDPDRFPAIGGLGVIGLDEGLRVVSVAADRHQRMMGYSENPDIEMELDGIDPWRIAAVIAAFFE